MFLSILFSSNDSVEKQPRDESIYKSVRINGQKISMTYNYLETKELDNTCLMEGSNGKLRFQARAISSSEFQILDLDKYLMFQWQYWIHCFNAATCTKSMSVNVLVELNLVMSAEHRRIAVPSRLIIVLECRFHANWYPMSPWLDSLLFNTPCIARKSQTDAFGGRSCLMMRVIRVYGIRTFTKLELPSVVSAHFLKPGQDIRPSPI